jgi:hypothetical protein
MDPVVNLTLPLDSMPREAHATFLTLEDADFQSISEVRGGYVSRHVPGICGSF